MVLALERFWIRRDRPRRTIFDKPPPDKGGTEGSRDSDSGSGESDAGNLRGGKEKKKGRGAVKDSEEMTGAPRHQV